MKKIDLIVIGLGGHSNVIINILERDYGSKFKILGYVDKEKKDTNLTYLGNDEHLVEIFQKGICENVIIGIGKTYINSKREEIIRNLLEIGFKFPKIISKKSIINKNVEIKEGTQVLDNVVVNCNSIIGRFCILNTSALVEHDVFIDDNTHIGPNAVVCGGTNIGKNCFVGANSTIIQNIKIADNVLIGAGGVVIKDIKVPGIYTGIPVRKVKSL